jgi:CHAT domain-containing protein
VAGGADFKATGAKEQAIAAYEQAIATLQSIRGDIVAANQELQFDFREQVEPVYRELMELLLDSSASGVKSQPSKGEASPVSRVVDILELLKLAELQNFFGDECVQVALAKGDGKAGLSDTNTAVVYSVILDDQTEMILRSPDGSMAHFPVPMGRQEIQAEIDQLRYFLELRPTEEYLPQAQKVYNLLIRPMEADLAVAKPSTLIFINDGVLRKVPMAALHDGKEFLVQKYPIAITPSLSLTNAKPLDHSNLEALSLGLTVERAPFAALTNVKAEVTAVNEILGGTELLDKAFTLSNLRSQLQKKSYPIVHMATHGKFGVDAETTFLVGYDQRISIEQIDNLLRSRGGKQSVELLTLSACQTAAGDNRSALGIAGVAVRAGVESALATLWYINDEATVPLIEEFYRQLRQPNITKAQALRNAQMKMISQINYNHPAVWSPFILIGNWL